MSESGQAPPGWYDDPEQAGQLRYWDGSRWTEDRRPADRSPQATGGNYGTGSFDSGGSAPSTWLWQSIVATLFCCLPLGIVGIVYAAQAQSAVSGGRYGEAREKGDKARTWTLVAVGAGVLAWIAWIALFAFTSSGFSDFSEFQ